MIKFIINQDNLFIVHLGKHIFVKQNSPEDISKKINSPFNPENQMVVVDHVFGNTMVMTEVPFNEQNTCSVI